jgi:hypothetical protein
MKPISKTEYPRKHTRQSAARAFWMARQYKDTDYLQGFYAGQLVILQNVDENFNMTIETINLRQERCAI